MRIMDALQEELKASIDIAAELMKRQNKDHLGKEQHLNVGDKVLLDGRNLKTTRPKAKLSN